ncbi:hypothetical protein EB118_16660 [bacterium]|nr:hypothetical protein [bacterium]NDG31687.1 hypothetical protein [bacterium]
MVESLENLKSDVLFLLSSAIHVKHGIYNTEQRLVQTTRTCRSIRSYVPDAKIYVLDGGYKNITDEEGFILDQFIDKFYNFSENQNVINVQAIDNHDVVKNFIELYMFSIFLNDYAEIFSRNHKRIFKISGRYRLNNAFNLDDHMKEADKIVIRGPFKSQFSSKITGDVTQQYMSRLWSFDASLTSYIKECYHNMLKNMMDKVNEGGYIDIEHLLFKHLDSKLVYNIPQIGIEGNIAPNGMMVQE